MVKCKDVLTGLWNGPDPVLAWARGSLCVFPQDRQDPVWIPERLIQKCNKNKDPIVATDPQQEPDDGFDGAEMGNTLHVSQTHADTP